MLSLNSSCSSFLVQVHEETCCCDSFSCYSNRIKGLIVLRQCLLIYLFLFILLVGFFLILRVITSRLLDDLLFLLKLKRFIIFILFLLLCNCSILNFKILLFIHFLLNILSNFNYWALFLCLLWNWISRFFFIFRNWLIHFFFFFEMQCFFFLLLFIFDHLHNFSIFYSKRLLTFIFCNKTFTFLTLHNLFCV